MRHWKWLLPLLLVAGAALWLRQERQPDGRVQGQVLSAVKVRGARAPLAGVSARARVDVPPLRARKIGADTASAEYHRYMNRCMACHAPPAPSLHSREEWPGVVQRMDAAMRAAGTLGLRGEERAAVLRFLERHAR